MTPTLLAGRLGGFRPWAVLRELCASPAQIVFSKRPLVGLLVLAATATLPRYLGLGLAALLGGAVAVRLARLSPNIGYAPYGYNALLVGFAIAHDFECSPASLAFVSVLGGLSVLMTAALSSLATYVGWVPVLSVPFVVTWWFGLGVAPHLALIGAPPMLDGWSSALPGLPGLVLQSLGGLLFVPKVAAGACVLLALLIHSRISTLLASASAILVLGALELAHAPLAQSVLQMTACNAALAAVALGGVWFFPSRSSFLLALSGALLTAFFALGCTEPLARLGLPVGFVPINAVVICVVAALRQRGVNERPRLADFAADSPEELLLADVSQRTRATEPGTVAVHLPFEGLWSCTQGVDGAFTHRGLLRHAYDFEVYGAGEGSLCARDGAQPEDFHCFGLPVLAAADGVVVAVEASLPNNAIGQVDGHRPWGNHVTLQHAGSLYSVVAHLAPGTIAVGLGQQVQRGALLGRCGNSGRSPRPHLHFQLQYAAELGAATVPCRFTDVVVRTVASTRPRFETSYAPREGEALRALLPDELLAGFFDLPIGAELTYRVSGVLERVRAEIDGWGRPILRSLDQRAELGFTRSATSFAFTELRGSPRSVLRLLRLASGRVPFEADPGLTFCDVLPERWLGGWLRGLRWDVTAPLSRRAGIERWSHVELRADSLEVVGVSGESQTGGVPRLQTRAVFRSGVGPTLVELQVDGRTERAELVRPSQRALAQRAGNGAGSKLALGIGEWS